MIFPEKIYLIRIWPGSYKFMPGPSEREKFVKKTKIEAKKS